MPADTCDYSVIFHEIDGFANEVDTAVLDETVPDASLNRFTDRTPAAHPPRNRLRTSVTTAPREK